ncbi:hotdog fold domain-containing protein [uncultured Ferrimonas sp.]|uniref:hotdog fold domain-containing protein n=1 Tax=uncultured Ferrimonas sp. TaxID=432640 RepID=UPI00262E47F3|nr:hotdog fold domain-containing protein [uncultured Ferrimonas sp.]
MENNYVLKMWGKLKSMPFGGKLMAMAIARQAPYFKTVGATVIDIVPHQSQVLLTKRRKIENHIGTVHVIAICNGLELAMGTMAEASIPKHLRWIPKGMSLDYTAKAGSDIRCVAEVAASDWQPGDLMVKVTAYDRNDVVVVAGTIKLWISEKDKK